jgi:hypothetical protein
MNFANMSRPTGELQYHTSAFPTTLLTKVIANWIHTSPNTPSFGLYNKVQWDIRLYFLRRGAENMRSMTKNTFVVKFEARLPMDKVNRICEFIRNVLGKRSCTKRELLQLLGHFSFASRVVDRYIKFVEYHRHDSHSSFCYRAWRINCQKVIKQM